MDDRGQSASELWLNARAPGFRDLPDRDRHAIFDFAFLWSLFEAQIMEKSARADRIREKVDVWATEGTLDGSLYEEEIAYFRNRYFANGALTDHFPFLNLRPADHLSIVQSVIEGANDCPRDRILCLLMIVWRLRNNLFHGEKWAYQLRGQLDNFTQANNVLMKVLERYGRLQSASDVSKGMM